MLVKALPKKKFLLATLSISVLLFGSLQANVSAITKSRLNSLINNRPFYDATSCLFNGSSSAPAPNGNEAKKGPTYIVGDSITEQSKTLYETTIPDVTINASSGRTIAGKGSTGNQQSGLEAVASDSETISKATTIIIALGTNGSNDSIKIGQMIDKIRAINKDARMMWVDTMVIGRPSYVGVINSSNKAIYGNSSARNYSVISWAKTVDPQADPQNLTGTEKDLGGYIRRADQYVHPTSAGQQALVKLVSGSINNASPGGPQSPTADSTSCGQQCTTTGTIPTDGENVEKMFKYFVSIGLSAAQAAGITGNAMAESGENIDPTVVSPSGYRGIFQWDAGNRWAKLAAWALVKNKDPLAFETQLEYAHFEAEQRGNIEGIKKQTSVELATWYWGRFYEVAIINGSTSQVPLTNVQHLDKRTNYARFVLDKYGGASAVIGTQSSSCVGQDPSGDVGEVVGEFAWPVDVKFWKDHPQWFTKPHHDYAASDIPVPTNTNVYSMTGGTVRITNGGGCGSGAVVTTGNAQFTYCHGIPGSHKVSNGDKVVAGQMLFSSDNTGSSTGPHLHVQIRVAGTRHCPQELFKKMGAGETSVDLGSLPTSGCSY